MPACRRLLFPFLRAAKEIGDVCTQASTVWAQAGKHWKRAKARGEKEEKKIEGGGGGGGRGGEK